VAARVTHLGGTLLEFRPRIYWLSEKSYFMQGLSITQQQINIRQRWFKSFQWNIARPETQAEIGLQERTHIQLLTYSET
jgi:hypothetical protein